jgi:hypothetical protein
MFVETDVNAGARSPASNVPAVVVLLPRFADVAITPVRSS